MNKTFILILAILFLNHCSVNENSKIWKSKNKNKNLEDKENVKKLFVEEKVISTEFNPQLKINITKINKNNKVINDRNDYGVQNYKGLLQKDES